MKKRIVYTILCVLVLSILVGCVLSNSALANEMTAATTDTIVDETEMVTEATMVIDIAEPEIHDPTEPESTESETTESETIAPEETEPKETKPEPVVTEPPTNPPAEEPTEAPTEAPTEPEVTEPEITEKPTEPEMTEEPTEPEIPAETEPEEEEPEVTEPEETEPEDSNEDDGYEFSVYFEEVNETVYANTTVNVRSGPSTDYDKIGSLSYGESVTRIGVGDNGWSKVIYKDQVAYICSAYLQTTKPASSAVATGYPLMYSDGTCTITIYREWYEDAWCYAAHIVFTDYTRFGTECANGAYNNGYETTSHAAQRLGAIFAVNGCYSAPYLDYGVVRSGVVCNDKKWGYVAAYSSRTGMFGNLVVDKYNGPSLTELAADGTVTDTFCFGPEFLTGGNIVNVSDTSRAQRTFIGTNGNAGDIWIVVSDGRYNDGESAGLTYRQCAEFLKSKGCTYGIPLDGGGSSTMYFNGRVLNAARGRQRSVVDFIYFK